MRVEEKREIISIVLNNHKKTITVKFWIKLKDGTYITVVRVFNIEDYKRIDLSTEIAVDSLLEYIYYDDVDLYSGTDIKENVEVMSKEEIKEKIENFLDDFLEEIKDEIKKQKINDRGR